MSMKIIINAKCKFLSLSLNRTEDTYHTAIPHTYLLVSETEIDIDIIKVFFPPNLLKFPEIEYYRGLLQIEGKFDVKSLYSNIYTGCSKRKSTFSKLLLSMDDMTHDDINCCVCY